MIAVIADLEAAHRSAKVDGFDLPSGLATLRATNLLRLIGRDSRADASSIDVALGEDGSIEISVLAAGATLIIDIPPSGRRLEMVVQDARTGAVLAPSTVVNEDDIVERIERPA